MKIAALFALVAVTTLAAFTSSASAAPTSTWYWTPGACKSELHNNGVMIGDGRTYNVDQTYCVGLHNHCWLSGGLRRYKMFVAVMRSYDGVVRALNLTVTATKTWSGAQLRILDPYMSPSQFAAAYGRMGRREHRERRRVLRHTPSSRPLTTFRPGPMQLWPGRKLAVSGIVNKARTTVASRVCIAGRCARPSRRGSK